MAAINPGAQKPPTQITISIDETELRRVSDEKLALYWHVAQANPASIDDQASGELAMRIGWEIIRRWLGKVEPPLYHHQQRHYYWSNLTKFAKWVDGEWVAKEPPPEVELGGPEARAQVRRRHYGRKDSEHGRVCAGCSQEQGTPIMWPCLLLRTVDRIEDVPSADAGLMRLSPPDLADENESTDTEPPGDAP